MKRISLSLSIALLAFTLGVVGVRSYKYVHDLSSAVEEALFPAPALSEVGPDPVGHVTHGLRVMFVRMAQDERGPRAEFRVLNEGPEPAWYWGYAKGHHSGIKVRQRGKIVWDSAPECGTGLAGQTLSPGEAATFSVRVPVRGAEFEAGFEFLFGKTLSRRVAWSQKILVLARRDT